MTDRKIRVFFLGTPIFAVSVLDALLKNDSFCVVGVLSQNDKPFGRKQELKVPEVKKYLQDSSQNIPLFQCDKIEPHLIESISALKVDFIVVVAFGMMLKSDFLDIAPCINIHASLLPKYRGASPIQEMIKSSEKYLSISAMKIDLGLDSGEMLGFSMIENNKENLNEAFKILGHRGARLCINVLKNYDSIMPLRQNSALSCVCKKIKKSDGIINFDMESKKIFSTYLAYISWPGISLQSGLKLLDIDIKEQDGVYKNGEILAIEGDSIVVGAKGGALKIGIIQAPSKNKISARDYLNGAKLKVGDILC